MIKSITSVQNSAFKEALRCKKAKEAKKQGLFWVEGRRSMDELLSAPDWQIVSVWVHDTLVQEEYGRQLQEKIPKTVPIYAVPDPLLARLADTETPQGVVALAKRHTYSWPPENNTEKPQLWVILENLRDPGNLGTILRTADSAGATGVICAGTTTDVYNPKVVRAAMGSLLHLPVYGVSSVEEAAVGLKPAGVKFFGAHLKAEQYHFEADLGGSAALLIGNEAVGLSAEAAAQCDVLIKIPMPGRAESLNAAIATGVLLYEAVRQRSSKQ